MSNYKNRYTNRLITETEYYNLFPSERGDYERISIHDVPQRDSGGDFMTSAVIGAVTDSAFLGGFIGGDMLGGIVGDIIDGDLGD
jgi:hypothetical protein